MINYHGWYAWFYTIRGAQRISLVDRSNYKPTGRKRRPSFFSPLFYFSIYGWLYLFVVGLVHYSAIRGQGPISNFSSSWGTIMAIYHHQPSYRTFFFLFFLLKAPKQFIAEKFWHNKLIAMKEIQECNPIIYKNYDFWEI